MTRTLGVGFRQRAHDIQLLTSARGVLPAWNSRPLPVQRLNLRTSGLGKRSHQVQLLPLLVRVYRSSLIVIHQLVEGVELALADAIESTLHVDPEVLVPTWSFERHRVVPDLETRNVEQVSLLRF